MKCVATRGEGIAELVEALDRHKVWLDGTHAGRARRHLRLAEELRESLRETLIEAATHALGSEIERAVSDVEQKTIDPYTATEQLLTAFRAPLNELDASEHRRPSRRRARRAAVLRANPAPQRGPPMRMKPAFASPVPARPSARDRARRDREPGPTTRGGDLAASSGEHSGTITVRDAPELTGCNSRCRRVYCAASGSNRSYLCRCDCEVAAPVDAASARRRPEPVARGRACGRRSRRGTRSGRRR